MSSTWYPLYRCQMLFITIYSNPISSMENFIVPSSFFFFFFGLINDTVVTNLVFASLAILWLKVSLKAWNHQRRRDTQWDWCGWWDQTEQAPEGMVWILSIMSKGEPLKNIAQGSHRAGFVSLKAQPSCRSAPGQGPLTYGVSLAPIPAWLSLEPIFQVSPTSPPVHGRLKISLRPHPSLHGTLFTDCFWTAMLCLHLGLISDLQRRGWPVTGGNSIQPPSCRQSWGRRQNRAGERRLIVSWQELEGTGFQGPQCSPRARLDGHGDEKWSQQPVDSDLIREMQENCPGWDQTLYALLGAFLQQCSLSCPGAGTEKMGSWIYPGMRYFQGQWKRRTEGEGLCMCAQG